MAQFFRNKSLLLWIGFLGSGMVSVAADGVTQFLPLARYDFLSLDHQQVGSTGGGLVMTTDDMFFAGIYTHHALTEQPGQGYPENYHAIELIVDGTVERHRYLALFQSVSDLPVYGGLHTYQAAFAYSYDLVSKDHLTLSLGGGLAVSDFGIEQSNGKPWPVLPIPLVRLTYISRIIDLKLEFITGPNVNFVIAPYNRIRILGDFRMEQFRNIRDLIFESALEYRLFPADHALGELAGLSAGFKSDRMSFAPASKGEELDIHYYASFVRLDLSLITISTGYAFKGMQIVRGNELSETGNGFFIAVQAVLPL